ncbi:MAG: hypothetical protein IPG61_17820 [bacterium]|nr:hypothetical protein [bacterium]
MPRGVVVRDGWCYVADNEMGLAVIDARILALGTMQVVSWTDSPGEALDIEIDGDYAFVADGPHGLAVFAIDGGAAPVHVGQVALEGTCRAIAVQDGLAVLAAQGSGLHFVDISNPRAPVFLGRIVTSYAMDICFSNEGMLLAVDRDEGMLVLISGRVFHDVTTPNPLAPAPCGCPGATPVTTAGKAAQPAPKCAMPPPRSPTKLAGWRPRRSRACRCRASRATPPRSWWRTWLRVRPCISQCVCATRLGTSLRCRTTSRHSRARASCFRTRNWTGRRAPVRPCSPGRSPISSMKRRPCTKWSSTASRMP